MRSESGTGGVALPPGSGNGSSQPLGSPSKKRPPTQGPDSPGPIKPLEVDESATRESGPVPGVERVVRIGSGLYKQKARPARSGTLADLLRKGATEPPKESFKPED
jgi:hypothetical protein